MEYGLEEYQMYSLKQLESEYKDKLVAKVSRGVPKKLGKPAVVSLEKEKSEVENVLIKEGERVTVEVKRKNLEAPIEENTDVGKLEYFIDGEKILEERLYCEKTVKKIDFVWCLQKISCIFLLIDI